MSAAVVGKLKQVNEDDMKENNRARTLISTVLLT